MFSRSVPRAAGRLSQCASQQVRFHHPHPNVSVLRQLPSRARIPLRPCTRTRNASTMVELKNLRRKHPFLVPLAGVIILFASGVLLYAPYVYQKYMVAQYHNFPEPVAQKLRRAVYYTIIQLDVKEALRYYRQAIEVADEVGMDPFSDEILGVKIQIAALFEKVQNYKRASEVLEIVRKDCLRWLEERGPAHHEDGQRTKVLAKAIAISVKLGELYAEHLGAPDLAEERLIWAVESALKEKQRRTVEGVKPSEGPWMTDEEIGMTLESLAHNYESKDQHYLATPLFLQALNLCPPNTCHQVVLMNNLSISLAQQHPPSSILASPSSPFTDPTSPQPPSRAILLTQATRWARKALDLARTVPAASRDEECDLGCAVATHNLGEFAEMAGDLAEARRRYADAARLAAAAGFAEGEANAREALERVKGKGGGK